MRICKLDTTSQIWGSGITDAQGNYGGTTTVAAYECSFTLDEKGKITGRVCADDGRPATAPAPDPAPCTVDAVTGDTTCFA